MNSTKPVVAENATALAEILGLTPVDGAEIQLRSDLNDKANLTSESAVGLISWSSACMLSV